MKRTLALLAVLLAPVAALSGTWTYNAASKTVEVELAQVQTGDPYRITLGIGIVQTAGSLPRVATVDFNARRESFRITADVAPSDVVLDPGTWVLMEPPQFSKR